MPRNKRKEERKLGEQKRSGHLLVCVSDKQLLVKQSSLKLFVFPNASVSHISLTTFLVSDKKKVLFFLSDLLPAVLNVFFLLLCSLRFARL